MIFLILVTNGEIIKALAIIIFTGGIPHTNLYIPAPLMLLGWAASGIAFLFWLGRKLTVPPSPTPIVGQAYYHRTRAKKSIRGQAVTQRRAVRRRYAKLES